ncbi:MAG TPA: hypothetical protein VK176_01825 [Phycisphaerales bacterium]|nr:hypothetical protein [Phycisphaerales bacterium]
MKMSIAVVGLAVASSLATAGSFNDHAAYLSASTNNTVINFDFDSNGREIASGTFLGNLYAADGVVFGGGGYAASGSGPVSSPNVWVDDTLDGGDRVFTAFITAPGITAVGMFNALFSSGDYTILTAFDAGDNVIGTVAADNIGGTKDFFGVTTATAISRIEVRLGNPGGWALDDLHLGQAVPAPGAAAVAAVGLLSLRRRR